MTAKRYLNESDFQDALDTYTLFNRKQTEAAKSLGLTMSALMHRVHSAERQGLKPTTEPEKIEKTDRIQELESVVKTLTKQMEKQTRENISTRLVREDIFQLAEYHPQAPKWMNPKRKIGSTGIPVLVLSDIHAGETVFTDQIEGWNKYNMEICQRRIERVIDNAIHVCKNHLSNPEYPGIIVACCGDLLSGQIHEELKETNDMPMFPTIFILADILTASFIRLADEFGNVFVPWVVGNHSRTTARPVYKNKVATSAEFILGMIIERSLKDDPRIKMNISPSADAMMKVSGWPFVVTHGDCLGARGGDGIIGAIGPMKRGTLKLKNQYRSTNRDVYTVILGHWHQYIPLPGHFIANGSVIGFNEFAHLALRAEPSPPQQSLFFVHKDYGIVSKWDIRADNPKKSNQESWVTWSERGLIHI